MATAPEGSKPPLEFEREEAEILQITDDLPLTLRVEESGCIDELGKLWRRYDPNTFDVFHLIGHASIQHTDPYNPYFITETLTGEQHQTTPMDLVQAFVEKGFPKLIFLSGCRTAQSGDGGEVSSMAEVLVRQGVPAVLGWGQAVIDGGARVASSHFYERLAAGCSIAHALGSTYRQMRKQKLRDWDRLRLYTHDQAWGCLVSSPGFTPPPLERVRDWFLDPETKKTRVATPGEFVGRRRLLQNCLRQLFYRDYMGVLLHGLGGVGKSTVAARLLERLPEYTPIVIDSGLDQQNLTGLLEAQCTSVIGLPILESFLPLRQKLLKFLNPHSAL
jgi:hypothetical protein